MIAMAHPAADLSGLRRPRLSWLHTSNQGEPQMTDDLSPIAGPAWIAAMGLDSLPTDAADELHTRLIDELEVRTGMALSARLEDRQLDELEAILAAHDVEQARAWLVEHVPDHPAIVRDQHALLTAEIRAIAPEILAAHGIDAEEQA